MAVSASAESAARSKSLVSLAFGMSWRMETVEPPNERGEDWKPCQPRRLELKVRTVPACGRAVAQNPSASVQEISMSRPWTVTVPNSRDLSRPSVRTTLKSSVINRSNSSTSTDDVRSSSMPSRNARMPSCA